MKQRWKKIASLMLVTICAFSLTACGKKEETAAYQQITDDMVSNCAEVSQSAVESLAGFSDDETLNQMTCKQMTHLPDLQYQHGWTRKTNLVNMRKWEPRQQILTVKKDR